MTDLNRYFSFSLFVIIYIIRSAIDKMPVEANTLQKITKYLHYHASLLPYIIAGYYLLVRSSSHALIKLSIINETFDEIRNAGIITRLNVKSIYPIFDYFCHATHSASYYGFTRSHCLNDGQTKPFLPH